MANANERTALERLLRPLSQDLSVELARALVRVEADVEAQAHYDDLADRHTLGQLTIEERAELEAMVRANTLLGILKAEARSLLANAKSS